MSSAVLANSLPTRGYPISQIMLKSTIAFLLVHSVSSETWSYSGINGPSNWPGLCRTGNRQSPIDIRTPDVDYALLPKMRFEHYNHSRAVNVSNNGKSVLIDGFSSWGNEQPYIYGGGLEHQYKLAQFHLHWSQQDLTGSEHTIGGLHYPAELHLVHVRSDLSLDEAITRPDGIAVVGVFLLISPDGGPLSALSSALDDVVEYGEQTTVEEYSTASLLPADRNSFYRYEGSLTTPGCYEAVIWTVLAEPISITETQIEQLRSVQDKNGIDHAHNFHTVQPLNGRRVLFRPNQFDNTILRDTAPCSATTLASLSLSLLPFLVFISLL